MQGLDFLLFQAGMGGSGPTPPSKFTIGVMGDSNANGASSVITTCSPATLYNFNGSSYDEITTQSVSNGFPLLGSIWQGFANAYKATFSAPVYLINGGLGGSYYSNSVAASSWGSAGNLRSAFQAKVVNGLAAISKASLDLIVVNLGINDIRNSFGAIPTAIADFYLWVTTTYPGVPVLVVQVGRSESGNNGSLFYSTRKSIIDAAITYPQVSMCCQAMPFAFIGGYEADNLHYNQATQNTMAGQLVRWISNSSLSKWARSLVSTLFDEPDSSSRTLINNFHISQVSNVNFFRQEGFYVFRKFASTYSINNILVDWSWMGYGAPGGGPVFAANGSVLFDGVDDYFATGIIGNIYNLRSSVTNVIVGALVKRNFSAGVVALFGASVTGSSLSLVQNGVRYRANDLTLSAGTDTVFADETMYAVKRNGTTKQLMKAKVSNASVTQANTGAVDTYAQTCGGINSSSGISSFINAEVSAFFVAGQASLDYDSWHDAIVTLTA